MRLFLPAIVGVALLAPPSARAQSSTGIGCVGHHFDLVPNGITNVDAHTRTGQPCQIGFGMMGGNVEALQIDIRPAHGVLGASEKEANRRFVAYAPQAGFVGRDQFEVSVRITPPRRGVPTYTTRLKVNMNVTP
jgi:hypothetical protein